jgi:hypothetical protein
MPEGTASAFETLSRIRCSQPRRPIVWPRIWRAASNSAPTQSRGDRRQNRLQNMHIVGNAQLIRDREQERVAAAQKARWAKVRKAAKKAAKAEAAA